MLLRPSELPPLKTWRGSLARLRRGRRQQQPARRVTCKKSSSALPRALTCTSPSRASCRPEEAAASSSCRSAAASAERWRRTRASAKPKAVACRSAAAAKAVACRSAAAKAVARLSGTNRVTRAKDGARACGTKPTCRRRRGCWRTEAIARGESYRSCLWRSSFIESSRRRRHSERHFRHSRHSGHSRHSHSFVEARRRASSGARAKAEAGRRSCRGRG
jgi:hypothetical protein